MSGKKVNWYRLVLMIILIAVIAVLMYELFLAEEKNSRTITKCMSLVVTYVLVLTGVRLKRRKPRFAAYKMYADAYKDMIRDAFSTDKKSYRKLMLAIHHYNADKYEKAITILDSLTDCCVSYRDTSAVLMFKALCLSESSQKNAAIETYEQLLRTDISNSRAWSNLGLLYAENGHSMTAMDAYENAIRYDSSNAYAYANLANLYLRQNKIQKALDNAQHALELNNNLYQAASGAAIACTALGETEKAEMYFQIYARQASKEDTAALRILMQRAGVGNV
ncbi:MAG: tetratricopeptide repeat protein, partial [Oscillospiraceae bacterium]|nr:tetratricopeptide repeat protein [Oscillospiraceae bacterium]